MFRTLQKLTKTVLRTDMNNNIKVDTVLVQNHGPEYDRDCLNRPSFLVNMRLFDVRPQYREIINQIVEYMCWSLDINYSDYGIGQESGVAATTMGFPFSIIVVKSGQKKKVMINPQIIERSDSRTIAKSNCGCCRLKNKIELFRYDWISVRYFDEKGRLKTDEKVDKMNGGFTIQHEIDHTIGFLITDRFMQQGHKLHELEQHLPDKNKGN